MLMTKYTLMKTVYIVLLGIFLVGCRKSGNNAEDVAEQTFYYLSKGDFERALDYCQDGSNAHNMLSDYTQQNIFASFVSDFSDEKELVEYFEEEGKFVSLFQTYKDYLFAEYEIYNSQEESDKKIIVNVWAERIDADNVYAYLPDLEFMINEYYYINSEQLNKILESKGEIAMVVEILENISTRYCQIAKDALINNARYIECEYTVSVEKINGDWLVTEIVHMND